MRDGAHHVTNSLQDASRTPGDRGWKREFLSFQAGRRAVLKGGLYGKARLPSLGGGKLPGMKQ